MDRNRQGGKSRLKFKPPTSSGRSILGSLSDDSSSDSDLVAELPPRTSVGRPTSVMSTGSNPKNNTTHNRSHASRPNANSRTGKLDLALSSDSSLSSTSSDDESVSSRPPLQRSSLSDSHAVSDSQVDGAVKSSQTSRVSIPSVVSTSPRSSADKPQTKTQASKSDPRKSDVPTTQAPGAQAPGQSESSNPLNDAHPVFDPARQIFQDFDATEHQVAIQNIDVINRQIIDEQIGSFEGAAGSSVEVLSEDAAFTAEEIAQVIAAGYTDAEISEMSGLGLSSLLIRKLANSKLELSVEESVACIRNGIKFGRKVAASVKDKHLVLMIGTTGVGKSTTLNYFHGCTLQKFKDPITRRKLIDVAPDSPVAKVTEIGHANSKTFIPNVVEDANSNIIYCDLPGTLDDRGAEINIANTANIKNIMLSAASVKVLFLLDYPSILAERGRMLRYLEMVLQNFFSIELLSEITPYSQHLLLGITKAPIMDDDEPLMGDDVLCNIFADGGVVDFPEVLRQQTLLIDPLNRRDDEGYSRQDWLNAIQRMQPLSFDESVNLTLSDSDILALTAISRIIAEEISAAIVAEDLSRVSESLGNMLHLKVIGDQHVQDLVDHNISELLRYFSDIMNSLSLSAAESDFDEVEKISKKAIEFVCRFHQHDDTMLDTFLTTLDKVHEKHFAICELKFIESVELFKNAAYQSTDTNVQIKMHYVLNRAPLIDRSPTSDLLTLVSMMSCIDPDFKHLCEQLHNQTAEMLSLADAYEIADIDGKFGPLKLALEEIATHARSMFTQHVHSLIDSGMTEFNQNFFDFLKSLVWDESLVSVAEMIVGMEDFELSRFISIFEALRTIPGCADQIDQLLVSYQQVESLLSVCEHAKRVLLIEELTGRMMRLMAQVKELYDQELERKRISAAKDNAENLISDLIIALKSGIIDNVQYGISGILTSDELEKNFIKQDKRLYPELKLLFGNALSDVYQSVTYRSIQEEGLSHFEAVHEVESLSDVNIDACIAYLLTLVDLSDHFKQSLSALRAGVQAALQLETEIEVLDIQELSAVLSLKFSECYKKLLDEKVTIEEEEAEALKAEKIEALLSTINASLSQGDAFDLINESITELSYLDEESLSKVNLSIHVKEKTDTFKRSLEVNSYELSIENYQWLQSMFDVVPEEHLVLMGVEGDITRFDEVICQHVMSRMEDALVILLQTFSVDTIKERGIGVYNLSIIEETFLVLSRFQTVPGIDKMFASFSKNILECETKLVNYFSSLSEFKNKQVEEFVKFLILSEKLLNVISANDVALFTNIRQLISECVSQRDSQFLSWVCDELMSYMTGSHSDEALSVINAYPRFKQAQIQYFNELTNAKSPGDIFDELEIDPTEKSTLKVTYDHFNQSYSDLQQSIITSFQAGSSDDRSDLNELLASLIGSSKTLASKLSSVKGFSSHAEQFSTMLSSIFGVWTIQNAQQMNYLSDSSVLLQPHSSQVVAILLLFGLHLNKNMQNHALQINTGEGKSLVNAISAIVFALMKYEVKVICYNPYLVSRDERAFKSLFDAFGVTNKVHYCVPPGAVYALTERFFDLTNHFLDGEDTILSEASSVAGKKIVAIMDELDVFFSSSFLGKADNRVHHVSGEHVIRLLESLYEDRERYVQMSHEAFIEEIQQHDEVRAICGAHAHFDALKEGPLTRIYYGLKRFIKQPSDYRIVEGQLAAFDAVQNTYRLDFVRSDFPFIALQELSRGNMTPEACHKELKLNIRCSSFSYAELPKEFTYLFGVTGTLFGINDRKKQLLEKYGIRHRTAIPSVFAKHNIETVEDVKVCAADLDAVDGYFSTIKSSIEAYIKSDRAVLVVFEDDDRIDAYLSYLRTNPYRLKNLKSNVLLASTANDERDVIIQQAARYKQVTIMNSAYARGSDFVCYSSEVIAAGGVAVLGCYFPETYEELVQMMGRTCRQDNPGSVELVLSLQDLEKFGIESKNEIDESELSAFDFLSQKREAIQSAQFDEIEEMTVKTQSRHDCTLELGKFLEKYSVLSGEASSSSSSMRHALLDNIYDKYKVLNA